MGEQGDLGRRRADDRETLQPIQKRLPRRAGVSERDQPHRVAADRAAINAKRLRDPTIGITGFMK